MLFFLMLMPDERLNVPAFKKTTWPLGQAAMALLICVAVAPGLRVVQMVARFGMPPETPALVHSTAREGLRRPDQGWAYASIGATLIRSPTSQPTWRRITVLLEQSDTQ